jgi:hypothetical protein
MVTKLGVPGEALLANLTLVTHVIAGELKNKTAFMKL